MRHPEETRGKVPEVTLIFWALKILATTLGETGGDAVSMSLDFGYLAASAIFVIIVFASVAFQIQTKRFVPVIYWATIIATTMLGTTLADFADRSLGIGYPGGSALLSGLLILSLVIWYRSTGSLSIHSIGSPRAEGFYWLTIMLSQTLGTALGDWTADTMGLGYASGTALFVTLIALVGACYLWNAPSRTALFWIALVLTRPLGAVVGDLLDKPLDSGGFALSRYWASTALFVAMGTCLLIFKTRAAILHPRATDRRH